jgi:atypical dual specificity phosphatase
MDWFGKHPEGHPRPSRGDRRPSVSEITDALVIGEYPAPGDIEWLKSNYAITAVHNLQDDEDLRINGLDAGELRGEYAARGIVFVRTPIQDGSADAMAERLEAALSDLCELMKSQQRVYLHCNAGMNRAPTLAIAYLRARCAMSLEEAMLHVKRRRPCGPFMTVLEDYFGPRHLKPGAIGSK